MGECGVRLLTDCLGGMDDPAKWNWWRKIVTRASSLAGGLFVRRPIRPATASKPLFIRAYPCHPWFIFPSKRAAPVRVGSHRRAATVRQRRLRGLGNGQRRPEVGLFSEGR